MKVYISGKITGLDPIEAKHLFHVARVEVSKLGCLPICPIHDVDHTAPDKTWEGYMRRNIRELMACDAILMLRNWKHSKGATEEHDLCLKVGIPVYYSISSLPSK